MRYLCTRFERVLCEFLPAGDIEIEGFVAFKKNKNFFKKRLPEREEWLPLQPGSSEPVRGLFSKHILAATGRREIEVL